MNSTDHQSVSMKERLLKYQVPLTATIVDAMHCLEQSGVSLVLVVNSDAKLVGTLSDGDIRRALLKGASVQSALDTYICRNFTAVTTSSSRAEILDLMQARYLGQIPVLDTHGRVVGLHLLREMLGAIERPNWAVIMAGGKGTRLRPFTDSIPKPMLKIAGRPILERLILHLMSYGIRRIFISVNYLAHVILENFGDGSRLGCQISYLHESEPLGTGGALSLLPEKPKDSLVVLNGDLVTQANIDGMLTVHSENSNLATVGVRHFSYEIPFGCIESDAGRVMKIEEKPLIEKKVNAGIYVLSPDAVAMVPKSFYPITNLFNECVRKGLNVGAYEIEEDWIDVGQHDQLNKARGG